MSSLLKAASGFFQHKIIEVLRDSSGVRLAVRINAKLRSIWWLAHL